MRKIRITAGEVSSIAELNAGATAEAIWNALPIEAPANTWGDEIYFGIPVSLDEEEDAREVVHLGEIAYWPPGKAFCIFFGHTPASRGSEIRAASAVNVVGKILGDAKVFTRVKAGTSVKIEKVQE
jgi:hypothetical protein